jgi:hypothetical protein
MAEANCAALVASFLPRSAETITARRHGCSFSQAFGAVSDPDADPGLAQHRNQHMKIVGIDNIRPES